MSAWFDLTRAHAPALIVAAPLIGAALAFVSPWSRLAWAIGVLSCGGVAAVAFDHAIWGAGAPGAELGLSHHMILALRYDGVSAFAAPLITTSALLVLLGGAAHWRGPHPGATPHIVSLFLLCLAGWLAALFLGEMIGIFLAIETAWIAAIGLVALTAQSRGGLNGALRMLVVGGVGSVLFLLGAGLIFRAAGDGDLGALARSEIVAPHMATAGFTLVVFSLALKAGVAPLHAWAGPALGRASGFGAAMIAAVSCVGAAVLIVRLAGYALTTSAIANGFSVALAALGAASVLIGSVQALGASDLRRLSGYALASLTGGVLLSAALGSFAGYAAALVQVFALVAAALGLSCGAAAAGVHAIAHLDGLARRAPLASAAITASALSLMSAPLTIGFLGRWRLVEAAIGAGWWWAAGAMVIASLAGVFYGGRLVERIYFRRAVESVSTTPTGGWTYASALIAAIAATALGLAPAPLLRAAAAAAALITGAAA